jgi:hypothetical protein
LELEGYLSGLVNPELERLKEIFIKLGMED